MKAKSDVFVLVIFLAAYLVMGFGLARRVSDMAIKLDKIKVQVK